MSNAQGYLCPHCNNSFSGPRYLAQHLNNHSQCSLLAFLPQAQAWLTTRQNSSTTASTVATNSTNHDERRTNQSQTNFYNGQSRVNNAQVENENLDVNNEPFPANDDSSTNSDFSTTKPSLIPPEHPHASTEWLAKFLKHCHDFSQKHAPVIAKEDMNKIKLIDTLRRKKATLDTHDSILEWQWECDGTLHSYMKLGEHPNCKSRNVIMRQLKSRHLGHGQELNFVREKVELPKSKAKVDMVYCDARDCMASLLTDTKVLR